MQAAGVALSIDLTRHAVVGLTNVLRHYLRFHRIFSDLLHLARERQPDLIIGVDFSGFNRRFARAVREGVRRQSGPFTNWQPRLVQYVSPQVWASRPGRARQLEQDLDLLLCLFPFEPDWYARHAPRLRVRFVGHPIVDRHAAVSPAAAERVSAATPDARPLILLLPGSREDELRRHVPVLVEAAQQIRNVTEARFRMVLPASPLLELARRHTASLPGLETQEGGLAESLAQADLALASSGTVTMECAFFGVPTVVLYKVSWPEFQVARRVVRVPRIAMPNLLANQTVYPELLQHQATPEALAREALNLLRDAQRRDWIKAQLAEVIRSLGGPGASVRSARAILDLLGS